MRILIAGASGAIGRALVRRRLRANQHEVFALTQSRDSAAVLKDIGAEPVIADALDAAAVKAAVGEIRLRRRDQRIDLTAPALHARRNEGSGGTRSQGPLGRQH